MCNYEKKNPKGRGRAKFFSLESIFERKALPYALILVLYFAGLSMPSIFAIQIADMRGYPDGGLFFTVCAVTMTAANVFLVKIAHKIGSRATLIPVILLATVGAAVIGVVDSYAIFLVSGGLYGLALGAMPIIQGETVKNLLPLRRGAGTATLFLAMDIAMGFGPLIWGAVIDAAGIKTAGYAAGAILLADIFVAAVVLRNGNNNIIIAKEVGKGE
jgi:MFS family permease